MKGTIDPFYNESFSFRVPQEELSEVSLVFSGTLLYLFFVLFLLMPCSLDEA